MKQQEIRSGSALVVVLGMMAVLMIMAVAFSVFMRTERSGMTNLKHALTARQTTQTAISRVMAAIDQSFVNPTNDWPVPEWNPPYISSWNNSVVNTQFWQNAKISSPQARRNNARLLTDEISRHLSPSQLALAKDAKVDWVTLFSGVGASDATTQYGPKNDMIIARYAFLALNTTGLLDMNFGPTTNGTPATQSASINSTSFMKYMKKIYGNDPKYITKRDSMGGFSSYAEMWRTFMGDTRYDYDDIGGNDLESDDVVTPDLFNSFSMSLDEVDPDSKMKLYIPRDTKKTTFTDAKKEAYAKLAIEKFKRLFRDENNYLKTATGGALTEVQISSAPLPKMTRAELAAQALVDYIDEDSKPSGGIWLGAGANLLNYPCTESVPMVTQAFAKFDVTAKNVETDPDNTKWYREYSVTLNVLCRAEYLGAEPLQGSYSLQGDFELVSFADDFTKLWTPATGTHPVEISPGIFVANPAQIPPFCIKSPLTPNASGSSVFNASGTKKFKVLAKSKVDPSTGLLLGYHKFSTLEDANDLKEVLSEIRISAKVVSSTDGTVQQVPAPALDALRTPQTDSFGNITYKNDYRIRVDAGLNPPRGSGYREGWALCLDPRFAYNTKSIFAYPSGGYNFWITGEMCNDTPAAFKSSNVSQSVIATGGDYQPMWDVAARLNALEAASNLIPGGTDQRNKMVDNVIFRNFGGADRISEDDAQKLMNAFSGRQRTYPDVFHSEKKAAGAKMFIDNGEDKTAAMPFRITNKPIKSMSEFGNLVIGPWETLSLFATFAPKGEKIDFHRVSDYFSFNEARFPKEADIPAAGIDAMITDEYLPALHYNKLNLNAQFKVQCDDPVAGSGIPYDEYNSDPLAAVLSGVPLNAAGTSMLSFNAAKTVAQNFYLDVVESGAGNEKTLMFRNVSDLANVNMASNASPVLVEVMNAGNSRSDMDRETFIGGALDRLTTRGQTYTVIIRADAYTPKYGSTSAQGGTTLATEYALVEMWRDSEPNRTPSGNYYPDKKAKNPPPVHGWFIRSCRFFSP